MHSEYQKSDPKSWYNVAHVHVYKKKLLSANTDIHIEEFWSLQQSFYQIRSRSFHCLKSRVHIAN